MALRTVTDEMIRSVVNRRSFVAGLGVAGLGAAAVGLSGCSSSSMAMAQTSATSDTAAQIFTAALIAEDLAITMYYNALVGGVIQDPNLAGSGGTALNVSSTGSAVNVAYLRAALAEEISHAVLLRTVLGLKTDGSADPVPASFYFPTGTFNTLANFLPVLLALETAFVAAYMTAVQEFASMAAGINSYSSTQANPAGGNYTTTQLVGFAKISAAILGVEAEHRTLARAIPTPNGATFAGLTVLPADDVCYESTDTLTSVYNGSNSAAAALGPFLATSATNSAAFSFSTALAGATAGGMASITLACNGNPPS